MLNYKQEGQGEPVVLIHGLFGSLENLGMIARLLKADFSLYSLDLPNHGRSPHIDTMTLPAMADMLKQWMDDQGLSCCHFLGHSLGGKVAMELALRYPDRVKQLIVADIAPVAYPRRHDDVFRGFNGVDLSSISRRQQADEQMKAHVSEVAVRSFLLKNLEPTEDGQWQWRINLAGIQRDYENLIAANSQDLPPFQQKTLFIKGELSNYILPEHKQAILALFPQASVRIIKDTNHWLHAEKPELFSGIVRRFLS